MDWATEAPWNLWNPWNLCTPIVESRWSIVTQIVTGLNLNGFFQEFSLNSIKMWLDSISVNVTDSNLWGRTNARTRTWSPISNWDMKSLTLRSFVIYIYITLYITCVKSTSSGMSNHWDLERNEGTSQLKRAVWGSSRLKEHWRCLTYDWVDNRPVSN